MSKISTKCFLLAASIFYLSSSSSSFAMDTEDDKNRIKVNQPKVLIEDEQDRATRDRFIQIDVHAESLWGKQIKEIYEHPTKEFSLSDGREFKMIPVSPMRDGEFEKEVERLGNKQRVSGAWSDFIRHWHFTNQQNLSFNVARTK